MDPAIKQAYEDCETAIDRLLRLLGNADEAPIEDGVLTGWVLCANHVRYDDAGQREGHLGWASSLDSDLPLVLGLFESGAVIVREIVRPG